MIQPMFPPVFLRFATCLAALALAMPAAAEQFVVSQAWVRGTVASQRVTSAYMNIQSDTAALIVGADSPVAERIELRSMEIADKGPLQALKVDSIRLEAKETLRLTPITEHLVLIGLRRPLVAGQRIPITLQYLLPGERHHEFSFKAEVRPFFAGKE